jgi:hypothetical protein
MSSNEIVLGFALVVGLLALSIFYGWRQLQFLRQSGWSSPPETEEGLYRWKQARRRLISSGLMFVLAAQLACALLFLQERAHEQGERADARAAARERGEEPGKPSPEERSFFLFYDAYWIVFFLVMLGMVGLALVDLWATRRFGVSAYRQLRAERREMIDRQIARLRQEKQERNGHG